MSKSMRAVKKAPHSAHHSGELGSEAVLKTLSAVRPEIFGPLGCLWKTHTDLAHLGFSPSPDILFCSKVSLGGFAIRGLTKE